MSRIAKGADCFRGQQGFLPSRRWPVLRLRRRAWGCKKGTMARDIFRELQQYLDRLSLGSGRGIGGIKS